MKLTCEIRNNEIYCPVQSEIENIAIEYYGTAKNIYFDKIRIGQFYLLFIKSENAWKLNI